MTELGTDLQLLAQLLNPNQNNEDEEEKEMVAGNNYLSPSEVTNISKKEDKEEITTKKTNYDDDFLESSELSSGNNDWKVSPKWDISYRQKVTASDVFLQMGGKNPSTSSCENMVIKVHLPGESRPNIDLKVLKNQLEVNSPRFFLKIPLPHPVNPQHGSAQFDTTSDHLIITLVMDREFDFVNF